jgi:hypothetical protein
MQADETHGRRLQELNQAGWQPCRGKRPHACGRVLRRIHLSKHLEQVMTKIVLLGGTSCESASLYYRPINQLTRLHCGIHPDATSFDISVRPGCVVDPSGNTEATA